MQIYDWQQLDEAGRRAALARPAIAMQARTLMQAQAIIDAVRAEGDAAVARCAHEFDGIELADTAVTPAEFAAARAELSAADIGLIGRAITNVEAFHRAGRPQPVALEVQPGVYCERLIRPIRSVGLYVPAGSAPLPSTVIMLALPARIAGCSERVLCTPPQRNGRASAAVLVAAELCGIERVFKIGGAQAIAAMAYGTATVPKVAKIFGPGNAWVTAAKQLVAADPQGAALDMPAGPSEVLVIADDSAHAPFVAADLLAQAEHDPQAQALLVTTSAELARRVDAAVQAQMQQLSRQMILRQSIANSRIIIAPELASALAISEAYAPEHLIIQTRAPRELLEGVHNAGSVFIGCWSPEPMGDYCSGTNHVLPTYGYARAYSGLSVHDFTRRMTVQELSPAGLADLGPTASRLAHLEGLDAHAAAVDLRLAALARSPDGAAGKAP
ncbi:MAG TPA: histidinol dehydrogenase [Steroidobacteraceae bacterium]|jgi:histidinol dehydrogenase|nr:histidinol dehydrogenase [Steroidobacteraceae bacterium]